MLFLLNFDNVRPVVVRDAFCPDDSPIVAGCRKGLWCIEVWFTNAFRNG